MKKRLLHLQLLPLMSGVQRFSLHLLEGLPENEYEIFVAGKAGGEFVAAVKERGWQFIPIYTFRHAISPLDLLSFIEIYWLLKRHKIDIIHTNSSKPGLLGRLAARLARVPLILFTSHGTAFQPHQKQIVQKFYEQMERLGHWAGDYAVFVNNSDRIKSLKLGLLPREKAFTIYNAQKELRLSPTAKKDEESFVIGSTIRFSTQKNVINLITGICKACRLCPTLKFIILGDGEHYALCKSIVESYRLSERILLPGWDSEVSPWLAVFDAFILYSRWEAMPFSIIEAMQAALPVIGSDIPSIRELVDSEVGWILPLDDERAFIQGLTGIASDKEIARQKGQKALKKVKELCDYGRMVDGYRALYEGETPS
ncbi:MAG: glycosyltransferase [Candidatus Cloacimonetes bacterium]|nr:glycosyltransferase [Candidatus Cloacimonadota bacterium]